MEELGNIRSENDKREAQKSSDEIVLSNHQEELTALREKKAEAEKTEALILEEIASVEIQIKDLPDASIQDEELENLTKTLNDQRAAAEERVKELRAEEAKLDQLRQEVITVSAQKDKCS